MTWIFWVAGALLYVATIVLSIGFGYYKAYDNAMYAVQQVLKEGEVVCESGSRNHHS